MYQKQRLSAQTLLLSDPNPETMENKVGTNCICVKFREVQLQIIGFTGVN